MNHILIFTKLVMHFPREMQAKRSKVTKAGVLKVVMSGGEVDIKVNVTDLKQTDCSTLAPQEQCPIFPLEYI